MLVAAEGNGAADVEVLDVDVMGLHAVVDGRRLARVPELVKAVVALAVAQLKGEGESRAFVEIAVLAGFRIFEAAADAIAAVQADLE